MTAIIKREFSSYFITPIGYVILALFWFFTGMFFTSYCISELNSSLTAVFGNSILIAFLIIPLMTMRTFSEERRRKTDQLLFTAPISNFKIIMGKFLGAFLMFCVCTAIFPIYAIVMAPFGNPGWPLLFSTMLGTLLFGASLIAIGVFISSLTENQIIAAVITLAVEGVIFLIDMFAGMISVSWITNFLLKLSFIAAYSNFSIGLINLNDIVFYLSVTALFLFFTGRVIARRRV